MEKKYVTYLKEAKISDSDKQVVAHIKDQMKRKPNFVLYGANAKDIIKMIEKPQDTHKWSTDFYNKVEKALDQVGKKIKLMKK